MHVSKSQSGSYTGQDHQIVDSAQSKIYAITPDLPNELLHHIFNLLGNSKLSLSSCAVVSRKWNKNIEALILNSRIPELESLKAIVQHSQISAVAQWSETLRNTTLASNTELNKKIRYIKRKLTQFTKTNGNPQLYQNSVNALALKYTISMLRISKYIIDSRSDIFIIKNCNSLMNKTKVEKVQTYLGIHSDYAKEQLSSFTLRIMGNELYDLFRSTLKFSIQMLCGQVEIKMINKWMRPEEKEASRIFSTTKFKIAKALTTSMYEIEKTEIREIKKHIKSNDFIFLNFALKLSKVLYLMATFDRDCAFEDFCSEEAEEFERNKMGELKEIFSALLKEHRFDLITPFMQSEVKSAAKVYSEEPFYLENLEFKAVKVLEEALKETQLDNKLCVEFKNLPDEIKNDF